MKEELLNFIANCEEDYTVWFDEICRSQKFERFLSSVAPKLDEFEEEMREWSSL